MVEPEKLWLWLVEKPVLLDYLFPSIPSSESAGVLIAGFVQTVSVFWKNSCSEDFQMLYAEFEAKGPDILFSGLHAVKYCGI
jgi:hypothetical protein